MALRPRKWIETALTAILTVILQKLWERLRDRRKSIADRRDWESSRDLGNVQGCLLTSVNLNKCGRIEKRTVFTARIEDVFTNDFVRDLVLEAAEKTTPENPFVCSHLKMEHRWQVLVIAQNHLSSIFGPYHLFSNQVSSYESCWYVFTLIGTRTNGNGRFFITPNRRLSPENDVGAMRIRMILVDEQEIRKICSGDIDPPEELFSERHKARWNIMYQFACIFEKQLSRVTGGPSPLDVRSQSWGNNLCGTFKRGDSFNDMPDEDVLDHECNVFLRIHVPIPLLKETQQLGPQEVVLYE
mmetsp:Transcript_63838/g.152257  ORF Transcript_63838/g.152257 Transcript_63838/m.152257 type:complete len:299 (+) Transcript_63838:151-1047(+)